MSTPIWIAVIGLASAVLTTIIGAFATSRWQKARNQVDVKASEVTSLQLERAELNTLWRALVDEKQETITELRAENNELRARITRLEAQR